MGGVDKGLQLFHGQPLVTYVADTLGAFCEQLIVSCNRNLDHYRHYGRCVVSDVAPDFQGPLSGLVSAFPLIDTDWLMVSPCDTPHVRHQEFQQLLDAVADNNALKLVALQDEDKDHPLHCLIHRSLFEDIEQAFEQGQRSVYRVFKGLGVTWLAVENGQRMTNMNSLIELHDK